MRPAHDCVQPSDRPVGESAVKKYFGGAQVFGQFVPVILSEAKDLRMRRPSL